MKNYYKSKISRSTAIVYEYFKRFPITNISHASKGTGLSFNSTAKAIDLLQEQGIVVQMKEIVFGNICHSKNVSRWICDNACR